MNNQKIFMQDPVLLNMKSSLGGLVFLSVILLSFFFCGDVSALTHYCSNCTDCNAKLSSASTGDIVELTEDISNCTNSCIELLQITNNVVFDCMNHSIVGTRKYNSDGIGLYYVSNNTVRNCIVTDFYNGIFIGVSSNNTIINNDLSSNNHSGIFLILDADNNLVVNNTLFNNTYYGAKFDDSSNNEFSGNNISLNGVFNLSGSGFGVYLSACGNTTITGNRFNDNARVSIIFDGYAYCSGNISDNLVGKDLKPHILINNVSGYVLENNENIGEILICNTSNSLINNITINNTQGMTLFTSNNVTISNSTFENLPYALLFSYSRNNTIVGNTLNFNKRGVYFYGSSRYYGTSYNWVENNTFNLNKIAVFLADVSSNNYIRYNSIHSSTETGVMIIASSNNTIYNNSLTDNQAGISVKQCILDTCVYYNSEGNQINENRICSVSDDYDIQQYSLINNSGINVCDSTYNWITPGTGTCSTSCSGLTITTTTTTTTTLGECEITGDYPPCGTVTLSEVMSFISLWREGNATPYQVIVLITQWSK